MKIHLLIMHRQFNASIEEVWEVFNDHAGFGKIMGQKFQRIKDSPDPANINGVGSTRKVNIPLFPLEETILKSEKPNRIEYQISKGSPFAYHYGTMVFKELAGGNTSLDYTIEMGSNIPLFAGLAKLVLGTTMRAGLRKYARSFTK